MNKLRALSLCSGMECGKIALKELGLDIEVWAIENDDNSRILADHNLELIRPTNDVNKITAKEILMEWPIFDFVYMGPPCQDFSKAGSGDGVNGKKSGLLYKCMEILALCLYRNKSTKYLIENVSKISGKNMSDFCKIVGHNPIIINSRDFSVQDRERMYFVNFPVDKIPKSNKSLSSAICLKKGERVYSYSKSARKDGSFDERIRKDNKCGALLASGINGTESRIIITKEDLSDFKPRKVWNRKDLLIYNVEHRLITVDDAKKIQTIPKWYDINAISKTMAFKNIGNGWTIEVIKHLFKGMTR